MEEDVRKEWMDDFAVEKFLKNKDILQHTVEKMKVAMLWRIAQALEEIWKKL